MKGSGDQSKKILDGKSKWKKKKQKIKEEKTKKEKEEQDNKCK